MPSFLEQFKRQPKIFVNLPSQGVFYNNDIIENSKITDIPVYGMNTMDELVLKTPDALFSGEATARILKSCIPSVLDPWKLINTDVDFFLIAIRVASYGEKLPVTTVCPSCETSTDSDLNLSKLLSHYDNINGYTTVNYNGLIITVRSITYQNATEISKENYVNEKSLLNITTSNALSDEQKDKQKQTIYDHMTRVNFKSILQHIDNISDGENIEKDPIEINNFLAEADRDLFELLASTIKKLNKEWEMPDMSVICSNEDCKKSYKSKITIDYSTFFAARS